MARRVLICGAGHATNGCVNRLLEVAEDLNLTIRIATRTTNSKSAQKLASCSSQVEVVRVNLVDFTAICKAMEGCDAVFGMTYSDHNNTELQQGKNLADACLLRGINFIVFQGGEPTGIDELDNKPKIESYFRSLNFGASQSLLFLRGSFFFENVVTKRRTKRVEALTRDGSSLKFSIPLRADNRIPMVSVTDIGKVAAQLIIEAFRSGRDAKRWQSCPGAIPVVEVVAEDVSPADFVATFNRVSGGAKVACYEQFDLSFFEQLPIPGAHLIAQMYRWCLGPALLPDDRFLRSCIFNAQV